MAYRRSITTRAILYSQRMHPSFGYFHYTDESKRQPPVADPSQPTIYKFMQNNSKFSNIGGSSATFGGGGSSSFSIFPGRGSSVCYYSSGAVGGGSDKLEYMGDVAEILSDKSLEVVASQGPVVSEVAVAAADSYLPVAALQYFIDGVHSFTGLNWWASIALTTLIIRVAILPLSINQMKASSKLALMKPQLEAIKEQINEAGDPKALAEGQKRMKALFNEHGVTPFTPLKGLFIQGPIFISFFMAITNMVEKVPSFKEGGALWFTDLTTPDALYIFPVVTSLTFLVTVECNMQEGMEGNTAAGTMKNFSRLIAVLTIPFTMSFPKAIFCYWVTSNFFSLIYGLVLKRPEVKKILGLPLLPPPSTSATSTSSARPQSIMSLFSTPKKATEVSSSSLSSSLLNEPSKTAERRIPSSSVMSQRIRSLEKQLKGKKKNKKR